MGIPVQKFDRQRPSESDTTLKLKQSSVSVAAPVKGDTTGQILRDCQLRPTWTATFLLRLVGPLGYAGKSHMSGAHFAACDAVVRLQTATLRYLHDPAGLNKNSKSNAEGKRVLINLLHYVYTIPARIGAPHIGTFATCSFSRSCHSATILSHQCHDRGGHGVPRGSQSPWSL